MVPAGGPEGARLRDVLAGAAGHLRAAKRRVRVVDESRGRTPPSHPRRARGDPAPPGPGRPLAGAGARPAGSTYAGGSPRTSPRSPSPAGSAPRWTPWAPSGSACSSAAPSTRRARAGRSSSSPASSPAPSTARHPRGRCSAGRSPSCCVASTTTSGRTVERPVWDRYVRDGVLPWLVTAPPAWLDRARPLDEAAAEWVRRESRRVVEAVDDTGVRVLGNLDPLRRAVAPTRCGHGRGGAADPAAHRCPRGQRRDRRDGAAGLTRPARLRRSAAPGRAGCARARPSPTAPGR